MQPTRQNLYRKYRPQAFSELLGQDHIVKTLQTAVTQGRLTHAYLFSGPRGTGKTSAARLLAKILNCQTPVTTPQGLKDACRTCPICRQIEDLSFMDIVEIDAASNNGVDDIRDMREKVKYRPVEGQYKVYIIDEVHMLSGAAFNAFLKTLEEPPPKVVFVLATTDPQKVPATILSRCQCFDFHSIANKVLIQRLQEVVVREREADPQGFPEVSPEALHLIAESVDGGFRDALSLLDQITSAQTGGKVAIDDVLEITRRVGHHTLKKLTDSLLQKDCAQLLVQLHELYQRGHDVATLGKDFLEYLRRAMLLKIDEKANQYLQIPAEQAKELLEQARPVSTELLLAMLHRLERVLTSLRNSVQPRLLFEMELLRIARREVSLGLEGMERRVRILEDAAKGGGFTSNPSTTAAQPGRSTVATGYPGALPPRPGLGVASPSLTPVASPAPGLATVPPRGTPAGAAGSGDAFSRFKKLAGQINPMMGAIFQNCRLDSVKDQTVTMLFEHDFMAAKANEPKAYEALKNAADKVFGPDCQLVLKSAKQAAQQPAMAKPGNEAKSSIQESIAQLDQSEKRKFLEQPSIKDALQVFGGEIIGIEKK